MIIAFVTGEMILAFLMGIAPYTPVPREAIVIVVAVWLIVLSIDFYFVMFENEKLIN